jgi:hypothetical protein
MNGEKVEIRVPPVIRSKLVFYDEQVFTLNTPAPYPNIWYRWWHWFFMGIRWERVT